MSIVDLYYSTMYTCMCTSHYYGFTSWSIFSEISFKGTPEITPSLNSGHFPWVLATYIIILCPQRYPLNEDIPLI